MKLEYDFAGGFGAVLSWVWVNASLSIFDKLDCIKIKILWLFSDIQIPEMVSAIVTAVLGVLVAEGFKLIKRCYAKNSKSIQKH